MLASLTDVETNYVKHKTSIRYSDFRRWMSDVTGDIFASLEGRIIRCVTTQKYIFCTVMSLLEAPSQIEAPPGECVHCHVIVAPPQNRSAGRL